MRLGTVKESFPGERRVALVPSTVAQLKKRRFKVAVEPGAGEAAGYPDSEYEAAGAKLLDRAKILADCDVVAMVRAGQANPDHGAADLDAIPSGRVVIAQTDPLSDPAGTVERAKRGLTEFALELVPRITRAQSMDVLSSMASLAGYKAVLMAADALPKQFPMAMTAAGTIKPARVFIVGAGVAGLQAIATAKRLGAVVRAYDVRPEVKEQVESLGGKFVEMELEAGSGKGGYAREMNEEFYAKQRELMLDVLRETDVVITTAAVPGKKAPTLVTDEMVAAMPAGSVVCDLAAERGGNCELTTPGETVVAHGVTILGPANLPSTVARDASLMYSNNVANFLGEIIEKTEDGPALKVDRDNEVVAGALVSTGGEVVHSFVRELAGLSAVEDVPGDDGDGRSGEPRLTIPLAD